MGLVRSWLSGTARALGVSVLVPAVLVGVLLGATVGGVGGLKSLRQIVAGPAIPDDRTAVARGGNGTRRPTTTLPTIPPGQTVSQTGRENQAQLGHSRSTSDRRVSRKKGARKRAPSSGTSPAPGSNPPPTTGPGPAPRQHPLRVVRNVGERVRRAVEPLPAPIGPTASDAIETVLDIVDPPNKKTGVLGLAGRGG
jgi:hypothetical protein